MLHQIPHANQVSIPLEAAISALDAKQQNEGYSSRALSMLTEKMLQVSPTSRNAKNISELTSTNEVEAHNQMVMQPRLSEYENTESQMLALPI